MVEKMFAVIKTGGKQYKVKTGDLVEVEIEPIGKLRNICGE